MKKLTNKLSLNKLTITNLDSAQMDQMIGGIKKKLTPDCSLASCGGPCGTRYCIG